MLNDSMNISHLMVHAQQVEEARSNRKSGDAKRARSLEGGSSKGRLYIQDNPRFKKIFSNKFPSKFHKARDDRVYYLKPKKGRGTNLPTKKTIYQSCSKRHYGDCLIGKDNYFSCCKSRNKVKNCFKFKCQDKVSGQAQASGSNVDYP